MNYDDHADIIERIATSNGVSSALIRAILALEPESRNLHGYQNRPKFKLKLAQLVDDARRENLEEHGE